MKDRFGQMCVPAQKVLVIGDDMRSFLACVRSFGRLGVEVHAAPFEWNSAGLKSKYIKHIHHLPRLGTDSSRWVDAVRGLHSVYRYDLIVPCDERGLLPLAAIEPGQRDFKLAEPGALARKFLFDKIETRQLAQKLGIPVAQGAEVYNGQSVKDIAETIGYPLIVKEARSYSAENLSIRGQVKKVTNEPELEMVLDGFFEMPGRVLVEAVFPKQGEADGIGVSVAAKDGDILAAFQHIRLSEKPGGGSSSVRESQPLDPKMLKVVTSMCEQTKLNGVAMFEFRQSRATKDWVLLEVNARPWGSMPLPLALGIDFPRMMLDIYCGKKTVYPTSYQLGVTGNNYVLGAVHAIGQHNRSLAQRFIATTAQLVFTPVRGLLGLEKLDSFVRDDLAPGLWEMAFLVKKAYKRLLWKKRGQPERRKENVVDQHRIKKAA